MPRAIIFAGLAAAASAACLPPEQLFVNFFNSPDQLMVSWASGSSTEAVVQYGLTPSSLGMIATGNTTRYTFTNTSIKAYTSPYLHHVVLANLSLATRYFYRVGGAVCGYSGVANVTSHPGVGAGVVPLRIAAIGDLGQTNNSADTLAHLAASPGGFTALFLMGDLSYADSDEPRWDSWGRLVAPVASSTPWMTVPGNHELEADLGDLLDVMKPYESRFWMPEANGSRRHYYSVNIGPIHWVMVSGFGDLYNAGSPQYKWLIADLAAVDRAETPWLIVTFHQPYYNSNNAHHDNGIPIQATFEKHFYEAGVDLIFSGHVHAYERSHRVYEEKLNSAAPYYVTIGDGGNREGLATDWLNPQPTWSAFRQASYGHGELTVFNATHMHWEWHQNPDLEPVVADSFWIIKGQATDAEQHVTALPVKRRRRD